MAAIEELDHEAREIAVTRMLSEARSWLAHAVEATEPASIATFKAQMATIAEATKQLGLSKEIQLDAQEMVRRAERGVGVAIRKGQEDGTVATKSEMAMRATAIREMNQGRRDQQDINALIRKPVPTDIAPSDDLTGNGAGIYQMTDDVSDEQFDGAIEDAKSEGNLSRANVVRKINGGTLKLSGQPRLDKISELAQRGMTSGQIAREIGLSEDYVRKIARTADITIAADQTMSYSRRRIDHDRIAQHAVASLEGLAMALDLFNPEELTDKQHAAHWSTSLTHSLRALNRFHKQIKEMTK
jgi:hypothetical protein